MTKRIPLSGKNGEGKFALVDDQDYDKLIDRKWYYDPRTGYTSRYDGSKGYSSLRKMHRDILDAQDGEHVDHINGDRLDNRRCNIRICTHKQNMWNRKPSGKSGYKGVYLIAKSWRAIIEVHGVQRSAGTFSTKEVAALAYDAAARFYFGEFAYTNLPGSLALSIEVLLLIAAHRKQKARAKK